MRTFKDRRASLSVHRTSKLKNKGVVEYRPLLGLAIFFGCIWLLDHYKLVTPPPGPKPYVAHPLPTRLAYTRPKTAPNGQPWPITAGYVEGYPRLHADGLSTVTVDNSRNDADVFVKLVSLDGEHAYPTRQFYVPAFGSFTLETVTAGSYDIRYRDLQDGRLSRSEPFQLDQHPIHDAVQFTRFSLTLYKVWHGNSRSHPLSEQEF